MVPGYKVRHPDYRIYNSTDTHCRRSLATWLWFRRIATFPFRLRVVYSSIVDKRELGAEPRFSSYPKHLQNFPMCFIISYSLNKVSVD